jgi:hypothetical protein
MFQSQYKTNTGRYLLQWFSEYYPSTSIFLSLMVTAWWAFISISGIGNSPKAKKHPLGPGNRNFSCRPSSKQKNSLWPYTFIHRKRKKEKTSQLQAVVIQTQRQVVLSEPKISVKVLLRICMGMSGMSGVLLLQTKTIPTHSPSQAWLQQQIITPFLSNSSNWHKTQSCQLFPTISPRESE